MRQNLVTPATLSLFLAVAFWTSPASAALIGSVHQLSLPINIDTQLAQFRRRPRNAGPAIAAGVAGAIIGGIIASQSRPYVYQPYPSYYSYPAYSPNPVYRYAVPDDAVAYCMRRYRSFDPRSMTYLGYDGYRHPCP